MKTEGLQGHTGENEVPLSPQNTHTSRTQNKPVKYVDEYFYLIFK